MTSRVDYVNVKQRRAAWSPRWVILLTVVVVFLAGKCFQLVFDNKIDLGNKPPDRVFRQVFCVTMPKGVTDVKIAGQSSLSGSVWMRFRVPDVHAFVAYMKQNPVMAFTDSDEPSSDVLSTEKEAGIDRYSRDIDWKPVYGLKHSQVYRFESIPAGHG